MAKATKTPKIKEVPVKSKKKILREEIAHTLEEAFLNIKEAVGEKKFDRKVKKASKVLANGASKKPKTPKLPKVPKAPKAPKKAE